MLLLGVGGGGQEERAVGHLIGSWRSSDGSRPGCMLLPGVANTLTPRGWGGGVSIFFREIRRRRRHLELLVLTVSLCSL